MKLIFSLLLLMTVGGAMAQSQTLNGNYRYSDKGDLYFYKFYNDSNLMIIHGVDTAHVTYHIDTTKNPMQIDLQMYDLEGKPSYVSPCIYEWVGKDKIRMRMSANMIDRPKSFLPKGNPETILLIRER